MKKTPTVNRRDLLLGASPAATLLILGAATTGGAIAQTAKTATAYVADVFQSRRVELHKRCSRLVSFQATGPALAAWKRACLNS